MKLSILESSCFKLDENLNMPFVRIHFLNFYTGKYLEIPSQNWNFHFYHSYNRNSFEKIMIPV